MVTTIHPVDATSGAPAYGGRMLRQVGSVAYAGASAADPFGARSGVRPGTSVTTVTATSTTWTVNPHAGLLDFEAAMESGPTPYSVDAAVSGAVTAAAASARIDIVWVRQDIPLEDGSAAPAAVPGYTAGAAGSGVPPTTPARCMVLAWINVPASGGGSPTVTWKATYAVAAGVPTDPWTAYTPSFAGLTLGNGTTNCASQLIGKSLLLRIAVVFGSTSAITGAVTISLPPGMTAIAAEQALVAKIGSGVGLASGFGIVASGGTVVSPYQPTSTTNGAMVQIGSIGYSYPSGSTFVIDGILEVV